MHVILTATAFEKDAVANASQRLFVWGFSFFLFAFLSYFCDTPVRFLFFAVQATDRHGDFLCTFHDVHLGLTGEARERYDLHADVYADERPI